MVVSPSQALQSSELALKINGAVARTPDPPLEGQYWRVHRTSILAIGGGTPTDHLVIPYPTDGGVAFRNWNTPLLYPFVVESWKHTRLIGSGI